MKKRILAMLCIIALLLSGIQIVFASDEMVITDVELPCSYTELYADLNIESPVFYDTLTCR